jgi:uncharacterized protein HemY
MSFHNQLLKRIVWAGVSVTLFVLGFFFITIILAVLAVAVIVFGVRFWWKLRQLRRAQHQAARHAEAHVFTGDFTVVERENTTPRLPPQS